MHTQISPYIFKLQSQQLFIYEVAYGELYAIITDWLLKSKPGKDWLVYLSVTM